MRQMKGTKKVIMTSISGLLIAGMLVGNVEYATHTYRYDNIAQAKTVASSDKKDDTKDTANEDTTVSKEETVYATLNADGSTNEVIVSDWLKNSGKANGVNDSSNLTDIVNTKGDETFTQDGESVKWNTNGEDIYYQGTASESLPVGMSITYKLDGEEVQPEDIVGKSGKLEINIQYTNTAKQTTTVNDKKEEIYTPFLMATGMILPVEKFSNIQIDNGQVMSEGDNNIVVAYGMPGLADSLKLDDLDFGDDMDVDTSKISDKITDSVKITADVSNFSMGATYTVATSDLFKDLDLDKTDSLDDLDDKMDDMKDASVQLVDGATDLQDGLKTLNDSFATYAKGIKSANKGAKALNKGAASLNKGTSAYTKGTDKLLDGVNTYVKGTKTLSKGVKSYTAGAKTVSDNLNKLNKSVSAFPKSYKAFGDGVKTFVNSVSTLLSEENMTSLSNGVTALKDGVKQVDDGVKQLQTGTAALNSTIGDMNGNVAEIDKQLNVIFDQATLASLSEEQLAAYKELVTQLKYAEGRGAALDAATNGKVDGDADSNGKGDLALGLAQLQKSTDVNSKETNLYTGAAALEQSAGTIAGYAEQLRKSAPQLLAGETSVREAIGSISTNVGKLAKGGNTLVANNKDLNSGATELINNAGTITKNSKKLTASSKSLRKGAKQLASGTKSLFAGTKKLVNATGKVTDGIEKLYDGSGELKDGMKEFKKEAVDNLTDIVSEAGDGMTEISDRMNGLQKASKNYQSFSGISSDMEGSVKFIMSTKEVKDEE